MRPHCISFCPRILTTKALRYTGHRVASQAARHRMENRLKPENVTNWSKKGNGGNFLVFGHFWAIFLLFRTMGHFLSEWHVSPQRFASAQKFRLTANKENGEKKTAPCFARFVLLTFRGPLASHDSNPYPNRSRIA